MIFTYLSNENTESLGKSNKGLYVGHGLEFEFIFGILGTHQESFKHKDENIYFT